MKVSADVNACDLIAGDTTRLILKDKLAQLPKPFTAYNK